MFRERYEASRNNLCTLLPSLTELLLYDNGAESDPHSGEPPQPIRLLHHRDQRIAYLTPALPEWAKPIAAVALNQARQYGKE